MIPEFDARGYLPPGLYLATLEEIGQRFGRQSELRRVQMESLRWLVDLARRAGVLRLVINGSFVTDVFEPNDVDCVLLGATGFPRNTEAESNIMNGLPFLEVQMVNQEGFDFFVETVFATDRDTIPKGMVEIIL
ncbi:MAG: hypothetical protein ABSG67_14245 [Thermoguttaceae bacterium]|jgi:hypothetical protein